MIDILFVNPPSPDNEVYIRDINRSGRRSMERTIWPQTSLAYLAAVIKEENYSVDLIDCIAEEMNWEQFEDYFFSKKPKFVVINVISSTLSNDLKVASLGEKINCKSIAVGPHVTELPEDTLTTFKDLDYVIMGEAELTVKELIPSVDAKQPLKEVKGIAFRDKNNKVKINEKRPFIENLDDLPIPLHELLPIKKYTLPFIGSNYTFVLESRGCPYFCTFCRQPIMWERKFRSRSPQSILKELVKLDELGIRNVIFHSDTFTIKKKKVIELCKMIIDTNLKIRWMCNSRVDTIDEEMLGWMKKAGCWMIAYGIESGCQEILDNTKKDITIAQIETAINNTKKAGIKIWGYFVMGLPGETEETIDKTIAFSKKLPLDIANFAVGTPYPGTDFYKEAKQNNWLETTNWEDFDQNYSTIVNYEHLSAKQIKAGIKKAYIAWYFRPSSIIKILSNIRSFKDVQSLFNVFGSYIKWGSTK